MPDSRIDRLATAQKTVSAFLVDRFPSLPDSFKKKFPELAKYDAETEEFRKRLQIRMGDFALAITQAGEVSGSDAAVAIGAVPLAGGVMTGPLLLNGDPQSPLSPVTLQFMEAAIEGVVQKITVIEQTIQAITNPTSTTTITIPVASIAFSGTAGVFPFFNHDSPIKFETNSSSINISNTGILEFAETVYIDAASGTVDLYPQSGSTELRFIANTGGNHVGWKARNSVTTSVVWELPAADSAGAFVSDGAGGVTLVPLTSGSVVYSGTPYGVAYYGAAGTTLLSTAAGTATTILHGNATGAPTWGAVVLTADVSGILPLANGGLGANLSATGGTGQVLRQSSGGAVVTVSTLAITEITNALTKGVVVAPGSNGALTTLAGTDYEFPYWTGTGYLSTSGSPITTTAGGVVSITPTGGIINIGPPSGSASTELRFLEGSSGGVNYTALKGGAAIGGTNPTLILPLTIPGSTQFVTCDSGGQLAYSSVGVTAITSLNGLTGATQTFTDGTNITVTSTGTAHTIGLSGQVATGNGGTGLSTYTAGDILYYAAGTVLSKLAAGTTVQVLHGGTAPSWGSVVNADIANGTIDLTTKVTGILPTANGGTALGGATPFTANGIVYASSASALATGSIITWDATQSALILKRKSAGVVSNFQLFDGNNTKYVNIHVGATITDSQDYTLPLAYPVADTGYALGSTTAGVMSWVAVGSGTVTGGGVIGSLAYWDSTSSVDDLARGTTTTVLHGNATVGGSPSWGAIVNADITNGTIDLAAKVTGLLPLANGGTSADLSAAAKGLLVLPGSGGAVTRISSTDGIIPMWGTSYLVDSCISYAAGKLIFSPTAYVQISAQSGTTTIPVRFMEGTDNGTNYFSIQAAAAMAGTTAYVWPDAFPTSTSKVLMSTTGGTMTWENASALPTGLTPDKLVFSATTTGLLTTTPFPFSAIDDAFSTTIDTAGGVGFSNGSFNIATQARGLDPGSCTDAVFADAYQVEGIRRMVEALYSMATGSGLCSGASW